MSNILDSIQKPNDIRDIPPEYYPQLAQEIRDFLIEHISRTGGHLASNLGTVELTMALHLTLDLPKDKIIWDVGHQSYTHKILTGRKDGFENLRQFGGMSGDLAGFFLQTAELCMLVALVVVMKLVV